MNRALLLPTFTVLVYITSKFKIGTQARHNKQQACAKRNVCPVSTSTARLTIVQLNLIDSTFLGLGNVGAMVFVTPSDFSPTVCRWAYLFGDIGGLAFGLSFCAPFPCLHIAGGGGPTNLDTDHGSSYCARIAKLR
jgi:hypothetical protein